jgi:hypothetical protein
LLTTLPAPHSGGNDRFCARLKTDISAFSSGLQGHLRSCLTILDLSWRPLSKNVRHDLVRPRRPELDAEMSVFYLAQKRSFPPLCAGSCGRLGRYINCPHLCCNFRRRFFVSLAFNLKAFSNEIGFS